MKNRRRDSNIEGYYHFAYHSNYNEEQQQLLFSSSGADWID